MASKALALGALGAALATAGCGTPPGQATQEKALAYELRIGRIAKRFAAPSTDPGRATAMLKSAIAGYGRANPPRRLAGLNRQMIAALRGELASLADSRQAVSAGDAGGLAAAQARGAAARADAARVLDRITTFMNACRVDARRC